MFQIICLQQYPRHGIAVRGYEYCQDSWPALMNYKSRFEWKRFYSKSRMPLGTISSVPSSRSARSTPGHIVGICRDSLAVLAVISSSKLHTVWSSQDGSAAALHLPVEKHSTFQTPARCAASGSAKFRLLLCSAGFLCQIHVSYLSLCVLSLLSVVNRLHCHCHN